MDKITRVQAIKAIDSLFDRYFGSDKGSNELYESWASDNKLCEPWNGEEELTEEHIPPGQFDILMALGITKEELIEHLGVNPEIFKPEKEPTNG